MLLLSVWKLLLCTSVCKYICTVTKHEPPIREPFPVTQLGAPESAAERTSIQPYATCSKSYLLVLQLRNTVDNFFVRFVLFILSAIEVASVISCIHMLAF